MGIQITVKDVDEKTFQEMKAVAVKNKIKVGRALTLAMHTFLSQMQKPRARLADVRSFQGSKGTERVSEQVDEILYGT